MLLTTLALSWGVRYCQIIIFCHLSDYEISIERLHLVLWILIEFMNLQFRIPELFWNCSMNQSQSVFKESNQVMCTDQAVEFMDWGVLMNHYNQVYRTNSNQFYDLEVSAIVVFSGFRGVSWSLLLKYGFWTLLWVSMWSQLQAISYYLWRYRDMTASIIDFS